MSFEVDAAIAASQDPAINPQAPSFFDKIVSKEIPSTIIHEDDLCMAFKDINPQGPVHFLVIPKDKDGLNRLSSAREDQKGLLGHLVYTAQKVAKEQGLLPGGFRLTINDGADGAQSVYHLHIHVIGGRQMQWPPG
jgi:histidine triad (HIT) family protein